MHDQINKDRDHWREAFMSIVSIVCFLSKNNFAFRTNNEKLYVEGNENFLGIIEIIIKWNKFWCLHFWYIVSFLLQHNLNSYQCFSGVYV